MMPATRDEGLSTSVVDFADRYAVADASEPPTNRRDVVVGVAAVQGDPVDAAAPVEQQRRAAHGVQRRDVVLARAGVELEALDDAVEVAEIGAARGGAGMLEQAALVA